MDTKNIFQPKLVLSLLGFLSLLYALTPSVSLAASAKELLEISFSQHPASILTLISSRIANEPFTGSPEEKNELLKKCMLEFWKLQHQNLDTHVLSQIGHQLRSLGTMLGHEPLFWEEQAIEFTRYEASTRGKIADLFFNMSQIQPLQKAHFKSADRALDEGFNLLMNAIHQAEDFPRQENRIRLQKNLEKETLAYAKRFRAKGNFEKAGMLYQMAKNSMDESSLQPEIDQEILQGLIFTLAKQAEAQQKVENAEPLYQRAIQYSVELFEKTQNQNDLEKRIQLIEKLADSFLYSGNKNALLNKDRRKAALHYQSSLNQYRKALSLFLSAPGSMHGALNGQGLTAKVKTLETKLRPFENELKLAVQESHSIAPPTFYTATPLGEVQAPRFSSSPNSNLPLQAPKPKRPITVLLTPPNSCDLGNTSALDALLSDQLEDFLKTLSKGPETKRLKPNP